VIIGAVMTVPSRRAHPYGDPVRMACRQSIGGQQSRLPWPVTADATLATDGYRHGVATSERSRLVPTTVGSR
jgi:hypothetical protein